MFIDLVKAKKKSKKDDDVSEAELDSIMQRLFSKADNEDDFDDEDETEDEIEKGRKKKNARDDMMMKTDQDDIDFDDEDEDEDDEDFEKALSTKERRAKMNQVYSMVDDLSDQELTDFLSDRDIKKAQVMAVFQNMSDSDLSDFVDSASVNGEGKIALQNNNAVDTYKGQDYSSMDTEKGHMMIDREDMEKALEMLGIRVRK